MTTRIDRSRIEADWDCPRRRYWSTEYDTGGPHKGITPVGELPYLTFGTAIHTAMANVLMGVLDHDSIATILRHSLASQPTESQNLAEGLFWAFTRTIWQDWQAEYDVIGIEQECSLPIGPHVEMMLRPDVCLRHKVSGAYIYPDFKSTGFKTKNWLDGWNYATQLQTGCAGLSAALGQPVEGAIVIGLYKGYYKDYKQRSPFTWIYSYPGYPDQGIGAQYNVEWCRGWNLVETHTFPGGLKAWVASLPDEVLREQLPITGLIPFNPHTLQNFVTQQTLREARIAGFHAGTLSLEDVFPMHVKSCRPLFGAACPFLQACHAPTVGTDPVGSGLYVPRVPHHNPELHAEENNV